jgi:hypothetical protein
MHILVNVFMDSASSENYKMCSMLNKKQNGHLPWLMADVRLCNLWVWAIALHGRVLVPLGRDGLISWLVSPQSH